MICSYVSGRLRPADLHTIKLVQQAAPEIGNSFSIIINKLEPVLVAYHSAHPEVRQRWVESLPHPCHSWFLFPRDERLIQEEPQLIKLPPAFTHFLANAPTCVISASNVRQLDIERFQKEVDMIEGMEIETRRVTKLANLSAMVPINLECTEGARQVQIMLSSTVAHLVLLGTGQYNWVPAPPQVHVWFGRLLGPDEKLCDCQIGEGDLVYFSRTPIPNGPYTGADLQQKETNRLARINARLDAEFDEEIRLASIMSRRRYEKIEIERIFSAEMEMAEEQSVYEETLKVKEEQEMQTAVIESQWSEANRMELEEVAMVMEISKIEQEQKELEERRRHEEEALIKSQMEQQKIFQQE